MRRKNLKVKTLTFQAVKIKNYLDIDPIASLTVVNMPRTDAIIPRAKKKRPQIQKEDSHIMISDFKPIITDRKKLPELNSTCNLDTSEEFPELPQTLDNYNKYKVNSASDLFQRGSYSARPRPKKKVVLITDDDYSNRLVVREILKRLRIPTIEAMNGEEAVSAVRKSFSKHSQYEIVLILLDLHMPVMTGVEATIRIRKMETMRNDKIPIVAVTAHDGAKDQEECFNVGMQDFVVKPVASKTLRKIVDRYAPDLFLDDN